MVRKTSFFGMINDDEDEMTNVISDDEELYDVLIDASFCQIFEDDRDSEFRNCE